MASATTVGTQTYTPNPTTNTVEVTAAANTVVSFAYTASPSTDAMRGLCDGGAAA